MTPRSRTWSRASGRPGCRWRARGTRPRWRGRSPSSRRPCRRCRSSPRTRAGCSNRDGRIAEGAEIPDRLAGQLVHPVAWVPALATAVAEGARRFVVAGPGKIMRALVYRNLGLDCDVAIADSAGAIAAIAAR